MKDLKKNERFRKVMFMVITMQFVLMTGMTSYASNYAKNGATWLLDQAVWIVITIMAGVAIGCYLKKATVAMVTTIVVGGVLTGICAKPEAVTKIGDALLKAVTGG